MHGYFLLLPSLYQLYKFFFSLPTIFIYYLYVYFMHYPPYNLLITVSFLKIYIFLNQFKSVANILFKFFFSEFNFKLPTKVLQSNTP